MENIREQIMILLNSLRRPEHEVNMDAWYCCPAASEEDHLQFGPDEYEPGPCNCGADKQNRTVDQIVELLTRL